MLNPGTYRARSIGAQLTTTKDNKEQIAVEFEVFDGSGTPVERITWFGFFTEKGLPITIRALRACGWSGADLNDLQGVDQNEVELVVDNEEWQGKVYTKVKFVNVPGSGGPNIAPLDEGRARSFASEMKVRILALEQGQKAPANRGAPAAKPAARVGARPPEPPPIEDDPKYQGDIPF